MSIDHPRSAPALLAALVASTLPWLGSTADARAQDPAPVVCKAEDVCRDEQTSLPLMALPRPFSNIYKEQSAERDAILAANVRAFYPLFVFDRQGLDLSDPADPKGWYQVGATVNRAIGWMQAKDVLEWRQTLVVAYTHPGSGDEARHPVLMFEDLDRLQALAEAPDRAEQAEALYDTLEAGQVPDGVVSSEASRFRDIDKDFYIFPVIDFRIVDLFDDPARFVQIAAAIPQERSAAGDTTTLEDETYRQEVQQDILLEQVSSGDLTVDIVFVMDMTSSMGPYLTATKEAIGKLASLMLADAGAKERVRFGLVGYRDDAASMPGLEFTAKVFTPTLVDDAGLQAALEKEAAAAPVGSGDYQEEVFAGIQAGLSIPWTSDRSLKFLVLVGDASAHEPGHPQSTTGVGAPELRQLADQLKVKVAAIHLLDPAARRDHDVARAQFRALASNPGAETPLYYGVGADALGQFETIVSTLSGSLSAIINATSGSGGSAGAVAAQAVQMGGGSAPDQERQALEKVIETALVEYLGNQAKAPRDIVAWAFDRDLVDPGIAGLGVRVLLTREQLNNLIIALEAVVTALKEAELTRSQFFAALQGVVTQTVKTADDIDFTQAQRLSETRLMPRWIESLPYRSQILAMSDAMYEALTADERVALERNLSAKLALYREINENSDLWHALEEDTADSRKVTPLLIDMLP